ncbi:hypothetical protein AB0N28_09735 [Streptomyces sp. NPDC051130]|uniref:hypothetical protein n=1 Tax=Streptomyces sp. NPDC051130 TaxID=3157223 RepID=UPI003434C1C1
MGNSDDARGAGVSDEEWARFVREAESGAGQAPKEPSARARMVTERLRREDEERAARERGWKGRKARRARQAAEPAGWRTGPAWQELEGRRKGRRRLKATAAVVFIAALALVAVRPELLIDRLTGKTAAREEAANAGPPAAETARPSAAPSQEYPDRPTLRDPFRGSPALQWADGAAGIELPEAKPVGGMSKEQVADAIAKTGRLLAVANLEPATLRGERPQAALDLLDPVQDDGRGLLEKALARPSKDADPLWLFSRFDPAQVRVHGDVVKTRGRMWFDSNRAGEVLVHSDYTFVYPLVQARAGADEVARTIVRRELTVALADPARVEATPGKLQIVSWSESAGNDDCSRDGEGYLHPMFTTDQRTRPSSGATGPVTDPYDRSKDVAALPKECGTVSRS